MKGSLQKTMVGFLLVLAVGAAGCATLMERAQRRQEPIPGVEPPHLLDAFAVSSMWFGDTWEIYVEGKDPDGDMDYIWVEVSQLGGNMWSNHRVYLKGDNRSHFKGVIRLPTPPNIFHNGWETLEATLRIRDRGNHYSNPKKVSVELGRPVRERIPEKWIDARNNKLGTVFFEFELDREGSRSRFRYP